MSDYISRKAISEGIRQLGTINPELRGAYGIVQKMINSIPSSAEERYRGEAEIELSLLKMWAKNGIEEIYKYKNRINWYRREGLARMELFHDITHRMFTDVQDTANGDELFVVDYKVRVEDLILKRQALSPSGEQKETPREALSATTEPTDV